MITVDKFGGSGITYELFEWMITNIPLGSTVLELGAGHVSTKFLSEKYKLYSVEDKLEFIGNYSSNYIYAPIDISINWCNVASLKDHLPSSYDCILVDGPTGEGNRYGFLTNIDLFKKDIPIIVDDTWREGERKLLIDLSEKLKRSYVSFENFSIITS